MTEDCMQLSEKLFFLNLVRGHLSAAPARLVVLGELVILRRGECELQGVEYFQVDVLESLNPALGN